MAKAQKADDQGKTKKAKSFRKNAGNLSASLEKAEISVQVAESKETGLILAGTSFFLIIILFVIVSNSSLLTPFNSIILSGIIISSQY